MSHAFVPTIPPLTYRSQPFDRMGLLQPSNDTPDYLRFAVQIGADGIDIHNAESLPGFAEQGYPHLEELRILKARVEAAGLHI